MLEVGLCCWASSDCALKCLLYEAICKYCFIFCGSIELWFLAGLPVATFPQKPAPTAQVLRSHGAFFRDGLHSRMAHPNA